MTAPTPPRGAVAHRPSRPDLGEVARWQHADTLPYFEVRFWVGERASVDVQTGPRQPLRGITDPQELRQCAWLLLAAARWLESQQGVEDQLEAEPDPQLSVDDFPVGVIKVGAA